MALRASDIDALLGQSAATARPRGLRASDIDALIGGPTLTAKASGSAGFKDKKAEAIWGGSFDEWKRRKEAADAEQARMVAESEAGNVGSRRAQDFQRKVAALNAEGDLTGDYSADSLRPGRALESGMEQGREQLGAGLQLAGETPLALADFFGRIRPKGETEQDRANPLTEAGKDIRSAAIARQQELAPLMIDRPDSLLSLQGAKYIAQSTLQSAPVTGTGLAAAVVNPAAGLSLMGAGAGSAKFADARAEDKNFWLAAEAGAAAAAAEVVPEMLPLGFLSGRLMKHLPGSAMKRMAANPAGRGALLALSEGASEGVTELANIAYEIGREGKSYTDDQIEKRLIDATAVGTVMGGGMSAVAELSGQNQRAYDASGIARLELENSLRDGIRPARPRADSSDTRNSVNFDPAIQADLRAQQGRETTARILGPTATPEAASGAQMADDAFRAAGVGTVAAADMAEQDALSRDLDAAQRDQLGSEAEIDRLLTGGINGETQRPVQAQAQPSNGRTVLDGQDAGRAGAAIPGISGSLPAGVRTSYPGDSAESGSSVGFVGDGGIGSRNAPAPQQFTELANGTIFVPGDPVQLRQRAADAGFDVRGLAETRDGVPGVRFGVGARNQVIGLFGGADPASAVEQSQPSAPPEAAAVIAPPALDAKRTYGDTVFDERAHDLLDFIALNGGLDRTALESEGIDPANWNSRAAKGKNDRFFGKPLFRKSGGMSLETLREKARDAGFRADKDVLDLIGDSLGGRKTFTPAGAEYQLAVEDQSRQVEAEADRQRKIAALPPSVPESEADAYIASRQDEFAGQPESQRADLADIESTLASVADTSPQQRASVVSLGHDYTAKLIELKRARAAGALNPDQQEAYIDLLEQDRETGKVAGRPMVGIGNKSAYVDAQMQGKLMPVQVFLDADNFKALNDKFGHDVGDDAIRLIADVVRAEFGDGNVFHRGGDEFLTQGMTQEDVDAKMARVQSVLANYAVDLPLSDGRTATLPGIGVSYGTGANEKAADDSLKQDKQRRKEAGLRFDRREGDRVGRVGSGADGAGTDASRADANPQDRTGAAAEGVGDGQPAPANDRSRPVPNEAESGMRGERGTASDAGTVQSIRAAISQALGPKFLARLDNQKWFKIVDSVADLPPDVRKSITGGGIAGFVLGNRVYVVAEDAAGNPVGVLLHELGVHYGMTGILGEDFAPTLAKFKRLRAKDDRVGRAYERATEAADKDANGELTEAAKATLDEEALAYFVEENWDSPDTRGIVAKVIDAIKRLLNRLGMPLSMVNASPELLREVAIGAARMAADGRITVGENGKLKYHRAFHGSPHDFDEFRLDDSTIGTGEGAQAFGHGLYFAGRKELGEYYRDTLTNRDQSGYALAHLNAKNVVARMGGDAEWAAEVISDQLSNTDESDPNHQRLTDTLEIIKSGEYAKPLKNAGRLYEVELAPDESDYLDWDAPLTEQSEKVRDVMLPLVADEVTRRNADRERMNALSPGRLTHPVISKLATKVSAAGDITGQSAYESLSKKLGGDRQASAALHAAGIPGIRYLDGSSRSKGEGSRNFVIFDDSSVKVVNKYSRRADGGKTITIDGVERPTTDSTGKAIHPSEDGVRNFWRWFAGSKITDKSAVVKARDDVRAAQSKLDFDDSRLASLADTHPLHQIITRSRAKHAAELDDAKSYLAAVQSSAPPVQVFHGGGGHIDAFRRKSRAIWMAEAVAANTYGDGVGGAVYPLYARIENPMTFDAEGGTWQQLEFEGERVSTDDLADIAESRGHDGLIINNLRDEDTNDGGDTPATHYAVFAPEQVKSSTGNSGTFSPTDARIAYSRKTPAEARTESAQKQADLGAQLVVSPGQSFVYTDQFTDDWRGQTRKMRERVQDKLLSVRDAQKDIEKIRGAIEDAANVYRRENLMHGRVGDQRDKLQDNHVKPLIEAMAEAKVSPALLEDYLEARHAKERNEKIAATKGGMPDGASGMTTAQAEDFLQGRAAGHRSGVTLDPAMTRQVSRLARKVDAITSETRRRLLDSGQITQEAFDALENAYAAYVPLRGKDGTEGGKGRGTGKGIDVRGKPVLRAAGRGEGNRAQNILAEVIADAERSIINAEKLRVGRTLARLVLENPNPDVWEIEPVRTELKVSDGTPEEIYEAVKNLDQEEGTIIVKVKGKPYRIVFADNPGGKRMADAMKNMAVETVPEVIQYVAGLNRYFSAVLTRYNPSFVGVNMTRDLLFGMTGIWAEHGTAAAAKAAASYFPAMRAAWRDIQGKPPVNAMGRYAREFAEAGGKTYFGKLENVEDLSQRIGQEFKTFRQMAMPKALGGESSPIRALAKVARDSKMVQAIEAVNDTVENTLRLSVYAARREAGASIEQSAEYAKNISVNFNRRGSATSWLNALYLFFNAATQGAHRTLTLLKNPKVQGVLGGLAALQATSAMFLMGLDDDDGEPLWDSISPWDKQRNLILAIPIKRENGWGATVIKIPMPYGFNLFPYMGGRSVELARDLQEKPVGRAIADYTTDAVVGVAQAMSPIPFDDGWKAALPHWVRIFTVLAENKDDLGIPVRAGDQYDSFDKPRSASGRDDTPLPFKVAATALNRLGGGDDYTPPYAKFALDWAPEDLAYLFKTFAGGLGSNVVKSGTLTEKLIAGVPVNFKDVPVLSSFVSNVDQRQATSARYYDHKDDIEREVARQRDLAKETGEVGDNPMGIKIARNKSGSKIKRGEGYELDGKSGSLFDTYKESEKEISRIRDEMRAAFNDQSISYTERIRKIDELKAEREEVQRELNAAWREQRKKRTQ